MQIAPHSPHRGRGEANARLQNPHAGSVALNIATQHISDILRLTWHGEDAISYSSPFDNLFSGVLSFARLL
jgi:hypothetical protein